MGYLPALDGLRALAVLAVMGFHAGLSWLPGGFLGVDLFFVLSGFLITSLLLAEHHGHGRLDLPAFWARRARRLLPALVVMLVALGAALAAGLDRDAQPGYPGDAVAALGYFANWHFLFGGSGYFASTAPPSPLQHTWSLSIEEQFYLLWPLVVLVVLAHRGARRRLVALTATGALASAAAMAVLFDPTSLGRVYYGTDTRAQDLLVGALAAVLLHGRALPSRARPALAVGGVAAAGGLAYAWSHTGGDSAVLYRGGMLAAALAAATVIVAVAQLPGLPLTRALSGRPLVGIGRISYGLYLWHWPVFTLADAARTGRHGLALLALRFGLTFALAAASYRFVETPIRSRRWLRRWHAPAALAGAVTLVAVATVAATVLPRPAPVFAAPVVAPPPPAPLAPPSAAPHPRPAAPAAARSRPARHGPLRVAFFGDSVAETLAAGLASSAPRYGVQLDDDGILGCGIALGSPYRYFGNLERDLPQCQREFATWRAELAAQRPVVAVLLVGRWEVMDRTLRGRWQHVGQPSFDGYLRARLRAAISTLRSTGARVEVLTAPYYHRGETPSGGTWPEDVPARVDVWNTLLRQVAAAAGVGVVDLHAPMDPVRGRYVNQVAGIQLRYDGVHVTPQAARWLAPWLLPRIVAAAG